MTTTAITQLASADMTKPLIITPYYLSQGFQTPLDDYIDGLTLRLEVLSQNQAEMVPFHDNTLEKYMAALADLDIEMDGAISEAVEAKDSANSSEKLLSTHIAVWDITTARRFFDSRLFDLMPAIDKWLTVGKAINREMDGVMFVWHSTK